MVNFYQLEETQLLKPDDSKAGTGNDLAKTICKFGTVSRSGSQAHDEDGDDDQLIYVTRGSSGEAAAQTTQLYSYSEECGRFEAVSSALNCGTPLACMDSGKVLYAAAAASSTMTNSKGVVSKVMLKDPDSPIERLNTGIANPLAIFRLAIDPKTLKQEAGTTFDLVVGTDAKNDAMVIISNSQQTKTIPSQSLRQILDPFTDVCQVEAFRSNLLVFLVYSSPNDTYTLLCVHCKDAKFRVVDTNRFKRGTIVHGFQLTDMAEYGSRKGVEAQIFVLAFYDGSKMKEFTFGLDQKQESRKNRKLRHKMNFKQRITQVIPLRDGNGRQNYLIRDDSQQIHLIKPDNTGVAKDTRSWLDCSGALSSSLQDSQTHLVQVSDQILVLAAGSKTSTTLKVCSIADLSAEEMVKQALLDGHLQTALNIVMSTGEGRRQLREYQLKLGNYSDMDLLTDFLENNALTVEDSLQILFEEKIDTIGAIEKLLEHAVQALAEKDVMEAVDETDKIALHRMQARTSVFKEVFATAAVEGAEIPARNNDDGGEEEDDVPMAPQEFVVHASFLQVANCLLYEKITTLEDTTIIKLIFDRMLCEAVDNYSALFDILPLESFNPAVLVPYLPPGKSQVALSKPFWQKVRSIVAPETFKSIFMEDSNRIYERVSVEYCYDLNLPGKALVILKDALQTKLVQVCNDSSLNLPAIALEAAERALYQHKVKTTVPPPSDRKERIRVFFDEDGGKKGPFDYFKETKWVFALNQRLYDRYIAELRWFLQTKDFGYLLDVVERHADPDLVAMKDQDIVQIVLDAVYLRLRVDSEHVDRVQCLTETAESSALLSNLATLTKSQNQQAFIDKHLKAHIAFIEAAQLPGGKSLLEDMEDKLGFLDLLRIQMAPQIVENAKLMERLCSQVIKSQLSMTKRLQQEVLSLGFRTGTKIFSKGLTIAKFGLNLFSGNQKESDSESSDDKNNGDSATEENQKTQQAQKEEQKAELKWVAIYQVLYRLLSSIGYEGKVALEGTTSTGEDAVFCLDEIIMCEILEHKDPQIIRHLLEHAQENPQTPHITSRQLFDNTINNIRAFYLEDADQTPLDKNFFVFHSYAKGALDLLAEYVKTDAKAIDTENRLLETVYYMTYNRMLEGLTVGQIRDDFEADYLIERCLQVHGIESYPSFFTKLVGLQEQTGGQKHQVVLQVLSHLQRTRYIDNLEANDCLFAIEIVEKHLIVDPATEFNPALQETLLGMLRQKPKTSKKLVEYLLQKVDKKSLEYLEVCAMQRGEEDYSDISRLNLALTLELQSQATHYLRKLTEEEGLEFSQLCKRVKFADSEDAQRLCRYSGEIECEARVKELALLDETADLSDVLMHAIFDPATFEDYKTQIIKQQEAEQQRILKMQIPAILRLLEVKETSKIVEILNQEFSSEDGDGVEFYEIAEQMEEHGVTVVGSPLSKYLLVTYYKQFMIADSRVELVNELLTLQEFNILHLNLREYEPDETKLFFAIHELADLQPNDKLLMSEMSRCITDTNLYQACFLLECQDAIFAHLPNVILPAILLYCAKLEFMISRLSHDLLTTDELLYGLVPKEALREALLTTYTDQGDIEEAHIVQIVRAINEKALKKAFQKGIGTLQDEVWRLREEEGLYFENEEEKVTELVTRHFIHI